MLFKSVQSHLNNPTVFSSSATFDNHTKNYIFVVKIILKNYFKVTLSF